jgi:ubiquinone biosynthesis protein COQ9
VAHFSDWADRRMLAALAHRDLAALRLRERVALAVRLRLEALAPYREAVRRSLSFLALPPNAALGAKCLYRTVDAIWRAAGDRSVDFSFYTKRALLAAVVSTTTLYWLDDNSEGRAESWAFLDRRIADVMRIPALRQRLGRITERLPDPFRVLRATRARAR